MNNYFRCLDVDIKFGLGNELQTIDLLKQYFKDSELKKTEQQYCPYDFYSTSKRIELKTRKNSSTKYKTTMIGHNKIKPAHMYDGEYYFVFKFTDGLFYIKYNKELFERFEMQVGGRNDRGIVENDVYIMIPIKYLTEI